ncbi:MAG: hypothetical protein V2A70_06370 [Candidatus Omnitrophota bacterium]
MKHVITVLLFSSGFLFTTYAMGQLYNDMSEKITGPMDRVIAAHNATYANVAAPGDADNRKSQEDRYTNMTKPINDANQRHFKNDPSPRK